MPGIEPGAFHMQSERATTALHPLDGDQKAFTAKQIAAASYDTCNLTAHGQKITCVCEGKEGARQNQIRLIYTRPFAQYYYAKSFTDR